MGIVELATQRLEELRRSGIDVRTGGPATVAVEPAARPKEGLPARAARRMEEAARKREAVAASHEDDAPDDAQAPTAHVVAPPTNALITAPSIAPPPISAPSISAPSANARSAPHERNTVAIDLERLASMGYVTSKTPHAQISHDLRVIKRELLTNVTDSTCADANLIMVTSSLPHEGKTFVAVNLAMSLASEVDRRILLVDGDVARPSLLPRLGLSPTKGFLDVLVDPSIPISSILLHTNIEKLTILPAGAPRAHATEMLASSSMSRLLNDLKSRYPDRVIVFDAPPLLPSTESRVLATRMGQVILVVEAMRTPKKAVEQALATIESCPMVLPLLNKTSHSEVGYYYGYYGIERD